MSDRGEHELTSPPRVSVVMAVYNGERYLSKAIQSILDQSYSNFEFIIVDDGSTDRTLEIIRSFLDPRILLIINEKNRGLAASLNIGISESRGEFIARMDCDDISLDNRLDIQVEFLDSNPDIAIVGSWCIYMDDQGIPMGTYRYPTRPNVLLWMMHFRNQLAHPSVMARRTFFSQFQYNEHCIAAQDYELWARAAGYVKYSSIPQYLLHYRIHESQMWKLSRPHSDAGKNISLEAIGILHSQTSGREIPRELIHNMIEPSSIGSSDQFRAIIEHITSLVIRFLSTNRIGFPDNLIIRGETTLVLAGIGIRAVNLPKITRMNVVLSSFRLFPAFPLFFLYRKMFAR